MKSIATQISTINVPFYDDSLYLVNYNGEAYTPMKFVVEWMGIDWSNQHKKLSQRFSKGMVELTIPSKCSVQSMSFLALRKLAGFMRLMLARFVMNYETLD